MAVTVLGLQDLPPRYVQCLLVRSESPEIRAALNHVIFIAYHQHRELSCWVGCESTETGLQELHPDVCLLPGGAKKPYAQASKSHGF
jgi:hypothetical protein